MKKELQNKREDYRQHELLETNVVNDAIEQFNTWLKEYENKALNEFNAMTLSTVGVDGKPSSRIVLLKGVSKGGFEFFTNYQSHKAHDIDSNPYVSLNFFWPEMERQVRIDGKAVKMSPEESDAYHKERPRGSQLGAWASPQSRPISREDLIKRQQEYAEVYPDEVPRPPHWGGYRVMPEVIEFWQGRQNRLHDRLIYTKTNGGWSLERVAP